MRSLFLFFLAASAFWASDFCSADVILLNGQQYETTGTTTVATHGFKPNEFSTPVVFAGAQQYVRIAAQTLNGSISPGLSAGTFFVTGNGYIQNAELMVFKTGFTPKRASEVFVYDLKAATALNPNGNPVGQVNSSFTFLNDFVINANLLAGPTSNFSLQLTMGEAYLQTGTADNSGFNTYTLNAVTAVPEPSLVGLAGIGLAGCYARRKQR